MEDLSEIFQYGRIVAKANSILTPEISAKIGAVHGTYLGTKGILIAGRDYSNNARMLKRSYIAGAMSAGIDVLNLHSTPLPLLQFCIRRLGATGGVYFSTGNYHSEDTTIRFYDSSGIEFNKKNIDSINELYKEDKIHRADPLNIGSLTSILQTFDVYKKAIPQFVEKKKMSSSGLKVVMDCSYGPTGELAPEILNSLNIDVIALNTYYKSLTNKLYPDLEAFRNISAIVKASEANIGIVFDSDGSRGIILDEAGNIVDLEDLFMLIISNEDSILKAKTNPLITSNSVSKILDDYSENLGYKLKRIQNLPGNISRTLREERGAFGAADTFKFYFPTYGPFSDGIFSLMKILAILAEKEEPLSSLVRNFPKTLKVNKTINVNENILTNFDKILMSYYENKGVVIMDLMIGIKIVYDTNAWVQVIPSLYRNSLILTSEASETKIAEKIIKEIEEILNDSPKENQKEDSHKNITKTSSPKKNNT